MMQNTYDCYSSVRIHGRVGYVKYIVHELQ